MTITPVDTRFWPVLTSTLAALVAALGANPNPPKYASVRPGIVPPEDLSAVEDACCAGTAWVRLVDSFPSVNFPAQLESANQMCSDPASYAAIVEMGVYRCVDVGDLNNVVSDDAWTQAAIQVANDAEAMRVAARAMQQGAPFGAPVPVLNQSFVMGAWAPVEVEGGCVGGLQQFTIQVFCPE